ncbi:unnamed protein product [Discosporangium mesarthrocarpum]
MHRWLYETSNFMEMSAFEQTVSLHVMSRFKASCPGKNKRSPKEADWHDTLAPAAKNMSDTMEGLTRIIPYKEWSDELKAEVRAMYTQNRHRTLLGVHRGNMEGEINKLNKMLPEGEVLDKDSEELVYSKPIGAFEQIFMANSMLKVKFEKWRKNYEDMKEVVQLRSVTAATRPPLQNEEEKEEDGDKEEGCPSRGGVSRARGQSSGGSAAHRDGAGVGSGSAQPATDSRSEQICQVCKHPSGCPYLCINCKAAHTGGGCTKADVVSDEGSKERVCHDCRPYLPGAKDGQSPSNPSPPSSGMEQGKKRKASTIARCHENGDCRAPTEDQQETAARLNNAHVHQQCPLNMTSREEDGLDSKTSARLAIVSFGSEKGLLHTSEAVTRRLNITLEKIAQCVATSGTMAVVLPQPWSKHFGRVQALFETPGLGMTPEPWPFVLVYPTIGVGRPSAEMKLSHKGCCHVVVIAHKADAEGSFFCNPRITVSDPRGLDMSERGPAAKNVMMCAERGLASEDIPLPALKYLVTRFTKAGDTVLCIPGDSNQALEAAISTGRRCEVYPLRQASSERLQERICLSFKNARLAGHFHGDSPTVEVGPQCRPEFLQEDRTPDAFKMPDSNPEPTQLTQVAQQAAASLSFSLLEDEVDDETVRHILHTSPEHENHQGKLVVLWGKEMVFHSPDDAEKYYSDHVQESSDGYHTLKMIMVADHSQLQGLLAPGKETCRPRAGLYVVIDKTCPGYYIPVAEENDPSSNMEIHCHLPTTIKPPAHSAKQKYFACGSVDFPVSARLTRSMMQMDEPVPLKVRMHPTRIVSPGFASRFVTTSNRSAASSSRGGDGKDDSNVSSDHSECSGRSGGSGDED